MRRELSPFDQSLRRCSLFDSQFILFGAGLLTLSVFSGDLPTALLRLVE